MLTIIFCWIVLFISISLIGRLFIKKAEWYENFWIGLAVVFGFLQVWSLFLPVNSYALITVFVVALFGLFVKKVKLPKIKTIKEWIFNNKTFVLVALLALVIISYYASQSVGWDDTLLYHFNAVKWGKLYSVVPGLANLHTRLGFNSSLFIFASMLDSWFMVDRSSHITLSIISAVLSVEYIWILLKPHDRSLKLFSLFTAPLMFLSIAKNEIIASFSPDFALTVLVLATAIEFIKKEKVSIVIAGILSILLVTVKFSAVMFSVFILLFSIYRYRDIWVRLLISGILLIIPFLIRNVYLTGWPLYPLPYFRFNVDWAVPEKQVKSLYTVIQTWAKFPGEGWDEYISAPFWKWFPVWYQRNYKGIEIKMFALAISMFLVSPLIKIFDRKYLRQNINLFLLSITSLASVLYIFLSAPDTRFGGMFVWVFFASVLCLYLEVINWSPTTKIVTIVSSLVFLLFVSWPLSFDTAPILKSIRWDQAWPTEKVDGVLMPTKLELCGNSELPCTPEKNKIRERVPGDMSKGYVPIE